MLIQVNAIPLQLLLKLIYLKIYNTVPYHCNTVLTDVDCRIQSLGSFYQGAYLDDLFSVTIDSDPPFGINFIVQ